jgi:hypothetical protein
VDFSPDTLWFCSFSLILGCLLESSRYYRRVRPVILRMSTSWCLCSVLPGGRFRCLGVLRLVLPGRRDFETFVAGVALAFLPHTWQGFFLFVSFRGKVYLWQSKIENWRSKKASESCYQLPGVWRRLGVS